ncbi:MAG: GldG family protein [Spirochaetaceae bacterium]|jgi:gliding-associated putative ABC transporter substrate-binding component GldG|nr:GldG family protein [Spirochaetaceae bacterium]
MNKKQTIVISVLTTAVLVLALLVSARILLRADLSKTKAYTISSTSRNLGAEIPEQVEITYFVSAKLKQLYPAPGEIEDLLREYTTYSKGKIRFTVMDPVKSGLEDRMQQLGIPAQQMQVVERNEAAISMVYSGILIEYLERYDVLPVVFSIDTLEYDVTSRIRSLIRETTRQAGILIADAAKTLENDFDGLNRALTLSGYKIRPFGIGEEIPETLPLLIVVGGPDFFDDWALYRIDRYIQQGGKVFFAVSNVVPDLMQGLNVRKPEKTGLLDMIAAYGAGIKDSFLLDPSSLTTTFNSTGPGGAQLVKLIRYPFWVSVLPQYGNAEHPITGGFNGVDLFWPNPLEITTGDEITVTTLFTSTPEAWLQTENFNINPDQAYAFTAEREATTGERLLAVSLSGKQRSFFRGKAKPERENVGEILPDLPENTEESRIVVVGNAEFAGNQFNQGDKNYAFIIAACDWLSNDDDIIGIRSRAPQTGRLEKIIDQEKRLAAMAFARILNTLLIPAAVLAAGFIFAYNRKKKSQKAMEDK